MAVISVRDAEVHISTSENSGYECIEDATTYSSDEGAEDDEETFVFCSSVPYTAEGSDTNSLSITGLLNLDGTGQNALRSARRNNTTIWLRVLHDGERGYQQEFRVARYSESADANGRFVEFSADFRAVGPMSALTGTS